MNNPIRYLAYITLEAATPLAVGAGQKNFWVDKVVARDANGLPYIPGTSLAGVIRHAIDDLPKQDLPPGIEIDDLFGAGGDKGKGSRLAISSAYMIGHDGQVVEGLQAIDFTQEFYSHFDRLPERDHVSINHQGVAEKHKKFDEQMIYKGARFVCRLELLGSSKDEAAWNTILSYLASPLFRIGSGTRKGFGKLKLVGPQSYHRTFELANRDDLLAYLSHTASLNERYAGWQPLTSGIVPFTDSGWTRYALTLNARDFFLFDAGFGDNDADNIPKKELLIEWDATGKPTINEDKEQYLIPATSVKGALSHRVAYHFNLLNSRTNSIQQGLSDYANLTMDVEESVKKSFFDTFKGVFPSKTSELSQQLDTLNLPSTDAFWNEAKTFIESLTLDDLPEYKLYERELEERLKNEKVNHVGEANEAVKILFGAANDIEKEKRSKSEDKTPAGQRGNVLLDDVYIPAQMVNEKLFNHVKIDRFTQGAFDSALYQEKTASTTAGIQLDIWVNNTALTNSQIKQSFEKALNDLCEGRLPLGGRTMKGHGIFTGTLTTTHYGTN